MRNARPAALAPLAALLGATLLIAPAPAAAQEELPVGKFGFASGLRQNTGRLGNSFGFGYLVGVGAGYQPSALGRAFSLGVAWEVLWGRFGAADPELVDEALLLLEMNFGLRLRRSLGEEVPRFLVVSTGVSLLRTNLPVPPEMDRLYVGPYLGIGMDQYLAGQYLLGFEARYGLIAGGPTSLSLVVSFAWGSR